MDGERKGFINGLSLKDIQKISGNNLINDEVVNSFLRLLNVKKTEVGFVTSHMYNMLTSRGWKYTRSLIKCGTKGEQWASIATGESWIPNLY